jgi:hypothetical protein
LLWHYSFFPFVIAALLPPMANDSLPQLLSPFSCMHVCVYLCVLQGVYMHPGTHAIQSAAVDADDAKDDGKASRDADLTREMTVGEWLGGSI